MRERIRRAEAKYKEQPSRPRSRRGAAWRRVAALTLIALIAVVAPLQVRPAAATTIETPHDGNFVGLHTSIAIAPATGFPIIAYVDLGQGELKVLACSNPTCAGDQLDNISSHDGGGTVGATATALVIDPASGNPIVAFYASGTGDLLVMACSNPTCAGDQSAQIAAPDTAGDVGFHMSLAIHPTTGNPVLAYEHRTDGIKVLACSNRGCTGDQSSNISNPDPTGDTPNLALDPTTGFPIIAYEGLDELRILACSNVGCSGDQTGNIAAPDVPSFVRLHLTFALNPATGNPVVAYGDLQQQSANLKVLACSNRGCTGDQSANISTADSTSEAWDPAMVFDPATGSPIISYYDDGNDDLKVLACSNVGCTGDQSANLSTPDSTASVGRYSSIAINPTTGGAIVAYHDISEANLKVASLGVDPGPPVLCNGLPVTIDMNTNGGNGVGTVRDDVILGTPGNDRIEGLDGDDTICAGDGDDTVFGDAGNDTVFGGDGDDRLFGRQGVDTMHGEAGADTLHGDRGNDVLNGGDGDDRIFGYAHDDAINGGPGNDRLHGNFGDDVINAGPGDDRAFGYGDDDLIILGDGDDLAGGNFGNDTISGQFGNDTIYGSDGNDTISGGPGNDELEGNSANDTLDGNTGNDTLDGGIGTDVCNGDGGTDTATRCETITGVP